MVFIQKNIFWFYITVKYPISMHVVNRLDQLVNVILDSLLWQVVPLAFDGVIQILLHELKYECETASWLIK